MFTETVFWFHPLVWWIGRRIVHERERACDEEVMQLGNEPDTYAQGILKVCELYLESPLTCVPGITGANLKKRIADILANRRALRLNHTRRLAVATAAFAAIALPVCVGIDSRCAHGTHTDPRSANNTARASRRRDCRVKGSWQLGRKPWCLVHLPRGCEWAELPRLRLPAVTRR